MTVATKKSQQSYMSFITENAVIHAVIECLYFCSVTSSPRWRSQSQEVLKCRNFLPSPAAQIDDSKVQLYYMHLDKTLRSNNFGFEDESES